MTELETRLVYEYKFAKHTSDSFERMGLEQSAEMWALVVARIGRILEDSGVCVEEEVA